MFLIVFIVFDFELTLEEKTFDITLVGPLFLLENFDFENFADNPSTLAPRFGLPTVRSRWDSVGPYTSPNAPTVNGFSINLRFEEPIVSVIAARPG